MSIIKIWSKIKSENQTEYFAAQLKHSRGTGGTQGTLSGKTLWLSPPSISNNYNYLTLVDHHQPCISKSCRQVWPPFSIHLVRLQQSPSQVTSALCLCLITNATQGHSIPCFKNMSKGHLIRAYYFSCLLIITFACQASPTEFDC